MRTPVKIAGGMLATSLTAGALAVGMLSTSGFTSAHANASGAVTETVSQVNTMTSSKCYREVRTETRYYSHSSTKGWVRLPSPTRTVTVSTHCSK